MFVTDATSSEDLDIVTLTGGALLAKPNLLIPMPHVTTVAAKIVRNGSASTRCRVDMIIFAGARMSSNVALAREEDYVVRMRCGKRRPHHQAQSIGSRPSSALAHARIYTPRSKLQLIFLSADRGTLTDSRY